MAEKKKNPIIEDIVNVGLVATGMLAGKGADIVINKVLKIEGLSGFAEMKKFASPAVRILAGGAGAYLIPNHTARLISGGFGASGVVSLVDYGIDKMMHKGDNPPPQEVEGFGAIEEADYEFVDEDDAISENFSPNLPELSISGTIGEPRRTYNPTIVESADIEDFENVDDAEIM